MDQQQLEARIRAIFGGDVSRVTHTQQAKVVDTPAALQKPTDPGFDPLAPTKQNVTEETFKDVNGNSLTIQRWPDGSIHETDYQQAPPKPQSGTSVPYGGSRQIEGTPDASKPDGYDNERPIWVTRDAAHNVVNTEAVVGQDLTSWREARERSRNPGGLTDQQIYDRGRQAAADAISAQQAAQSASAEKRAEATAAKPNVTLTQDGTQAVVTYPDGRVETKPTGLPRLPKPGEIVKGGWPGGADAQAITDPTTGRIHLEPLPGAAAPGTGGFVDETGAPALNVTRGQVAAGLSAYSDWLAAQVKRYRDTQGREGISP